MVDYHGWRPPLTPSQLRRQVTRRAASRVARLRPVLTDRPEVTPAALRAPYGFGAWARLAREERIEHARKIIKGQVFDDLVAAHGVTAEDDTPGYFPPVPNSRTQWNKNYKAHHRELVESLAHFAAEAAPATPSALRAPHSADEWLGLGADGRLRHIREKVTAELLAILPPRPTPLASDPYATPPAS